MHSSIVAFLAIVAVVAAAPKPGLLYTVPAASSDTSVIRDALGNQQTSYAYQDGHSSAVAVTRNDVSKHLLVQPVVQHVQPQLVYQSAPVYQHAYHHAYQYQAPQYHHQAPLVYTHESLPYYL